MLHTVYIFINLEIIRVNLEYWVDFSSYLDISGEKRLKLSCKSYLDAKTGFRFLRLVVPLKFKEKYLMPL
jgi:hypothetical protein